MKGYNRSIVALLTMLMLLGVVLDLLPNFYVSCANNPVITISQVSAKDMKEIRILCSDVNENVYEAQGSPKSGGLKEFFHLDEGMLGHISADGSNYTGTISIYVDMSSYKDLGQAMKQAVMQAALETIANSSVSSTNRNKIYNFVANEDTSVSSLVRQLSNDVTADFAGAYGSFKPFSGVVGWVLGILSLGIFVLLGITVVLDLAYINIPIIQVWLTSSKDGKAKFISSEAQKAVQESESKSNSGANAGVLYFKLKSKQLIALGVCLLYLVSGKLYVLIAIIIDYFNGILPK